MNFILVIPTFNPGKIWLDCIEAIKRQTLQPDLVLVVDSGSTDNTVEAVIEAGFQLMRIEKHKFNHGGTRQSAIEGRDGLDFVVFLTQDAVLADPDALKNILLPFDDGDIAAVCGRQLPRKEAGPVESHARRYNYPEHPFVRSIRDVKQYGLKTAFISNSFAAYRLSKLAEVGGFPDDVIFGEDMYVAAKLLKCGYKIAYASDACVYHSHNYTLLQEFRRYFDMGVFHSRESWLRRELGAAEGEGIKFVISELRFLLERAWWLIPAGLVRTLLRYSGFRLGMAESSIPSGIKKNLSMSPDYFT